MHLPKSLTSQPAPDFRCAAVLPDGTIVDTYEFHRARGDKLAVVVFYPLDFTFVCPSELIALDHRVKAFDERGVEVVTVSIDSQYTHLAWRNTPVDKGGIGPVRFTMAADVRHEICRAYGVEHSDGVALRGAFVIDRQGLVRSQIVNDLPIGRNIDELVRIVDAVEFHAEHGEVCPAGWQRGESGMQATPDGVASYLAANAPNL